MYTCVFVNLNVIIKKGINVNKVLAMDCEMCLTENGSELTRISLIDEDNNVINTFFKILIN